MDELQMSYRHPIWKVVESMLQDSINIVENFAQKNGFKLSTSKTSMVHFTKMSIPPPIELRIGNIRIQKSETVKYLGLAFDLKIGADQKTLMIIYRSRIRSKIDYGFIS